MIQKPKGTRDFLPEEMEARNKVFATLRNVAKQYGYGEIETPDFESMEALTKKAGAEVKEQIFVLEKKGSEEFGLRFDMTVPAARLFVEQQKAIKKPARWFYLCKNWRYEAPQKGRLREFYQFGVELFGSNYPEADAEVISLAIDSLVALGLTKDDFVVKINNRKLLEGFLEGIEARDIEAITRAIDKSRKISEQDFEKELDAANASKEQISKIKEFITIKQVGKLAGLSEKAKEGIKEIERVMDFLDAMGKREFVEFDASIARGLTYYTGTVFECFDKKETLRSIFAGGRYDNLIELFGGQPTGATGFAMGDVTLQLLLESKKRWPKAGQETEYVVVPVNEDVYEDALQITQQLRKKSSAIIDISRRNLKNQLDYANSINAKKAVIVGKQELDKGMVKVKDLRTGNEEFVKIEQI